MAYIDSRTHKLTIPCGSGLPDPSWVLHKGLLWSLLRSERVRACGGREGALRSMSVVKELGI